MAKTVDELLIKIKADTKELEKKLKNVKGELEAQVLLHSVVQVLQVL